MIKQRYEVAKHNALIEASYSLDVTEQRVILLAFIQARDCKQMIDANTLLEITAESYQKHFGVDDSTAYRALKSVAKSLIKKNFTYYEREPRTFKILAQYHSNWVHKIGYREEEGCLQVAFGMDVIPQFTRLSEHFTKYDLEKVSKLSSKYAIRLYEIAIKWRYQNCVSDEIPLDQLRAMLGVENDKYQHMHQFKSRVLDKAVEQVNEFTDIELSYEQKKRGRFVNRFVFSFKFKQSKKQKATKDPAQLPTPPQKMSDFVTMSITQINSFSAKIATSKYAGDLAKVGESQTAFENRMKQELMDPAQQKKYHKALIGLGFKA